MYKTVAIFTDSESVLRTTVDWMPLWQKKGTKSADGKYAAHAEKLMYLWELAQRRTQPVLMGKVKAHKKNVERAQSNKKADEQAKEEAKEGTVWQPQFQLIPIAKLEKERIEQIDLVGFQKKILK